MPDPSADLPNDIETLRRLVIEQRAALAARDLEIETLRMQLARLRRMQFGRSSEKLDRAIAQLELQLEDLEESTAAAQPAIPAEACVFRRNPATDSDAIRPPVPSDAGHPPEVS